MPQSLENKYLGNTAKIDEVSDTHQWWLASGSQLKRDLNAVVLLGLKNKLQAVCPEKDFGYKEPEGIDPVRIAKEKGDVVDHFLPRQAGQKEIISTGDVVFSWSRPGQNSEGVVYLSRPDRAVDPEDPVSEVAARLQAAQQAEQLYADGPFTAAWLVGLDIRERGGWEHLAGILIQAEMNEIPKDEIDRRVNRANSLKDNSMVNLVSLLPKYGKRVTIRNIADDGVQEVEMRPDDLLIPLLVLGCAPPHTLLSQLIDAETPVNADGTKSLSFAEYAMIARERE